MPLFPRLDFVAHAPWQCGKSQCSGSFGQITHVSIWNGAALTRLDAQPVAAFLESWRPNELGWFCVPVPLTICMWLLWVVHAWAVWTCSSFPMALKASHVHSASCGPASGARWDQVPGKKSLERQNAKAANGWNNKDFNQTCKSPAWTSSDFEHICPFGGYFSESAEKHFAPAAFLV